MKYFIIGIILIQIIFSTFIVHNSMSHSNTNYVLAIEQVDSNAFNVDINNDTYEDLNSIQVNKLLIRIGSDSIKPNIRLHVKN
jgi:hypothetical protein